MKTIVSIDDLIRPGNQFVIKYCKLDDDEMKNRFRREAHFCEFVSGIYKPSVSIAFVC